MAEHKTHKDLIVWKRSRNFIKNIYELTNDFPASELYGLTSQLRRAAVSITVNISEGYARNSDKELIHFLYISLGSISEIETLLLIVSDLEFKDHNHISPLLNEIEEIRKMLLSLIKHNKSKINFGK